VRPDNGFCFELLCEYDEAFNVKLKLTFKFQIPLTSLVKNKAVLYTALVATFIVSIILSYTSAGFPYSGAIDDPRAQRHYVTHTMRTFYDSSGGIRHSDVGYYMLENERNTKRTLDTIFDPATLTLERDNEMCATEAFCGFPTYNKTNAYWIVTTVKPDIDRTILTLESTTRSSSSLDMNFSFIGSYMSYLYVVLEDGVDFISSSIAFNKREWITGGKEARYIKVVYGLNTSEPFPFTLTLNTAAAISEDLVRVTVVTTDQHFDVHPHKEEFQQLIDKFPSFTFVQSHQSDVSSYTFREI